MTEIHSGLGRRVQHRVTRLGPGPLNQVGRSSSSPQANSFRDNSDSVLFSRADAKALRVPTRDQGDLKDGRAESEEVTTVGDKAAQRIRVDDPTFSLSLPAESGAIVNNNGTITTFSPDYSSHSPAKMDTMRGTLLGSLNSFVSMSVQGIGSAEAGSTFEQLPAKNAPWEIS